jgi:hypothetical protein
VVRNRELIANDNGARLLRGSSQIASEQRAEHLAYDGFDFNWIHVHGFNKFLA